MHSAGEVVMSARTRLRGAPWLCACAAVLILWGAVPAGAQPNNNKAAPPVAKSYANPPATTPAASKQAVEAKLKEADDKAQAAIAAGSSTDDATVPPPDIQPNNAPNLFGMWFQGGPLMYPITLMSIIVVMMSVERWIGVRRGKTVPRKLAEALRQMTRSGSFDPRQAYQLCQQYPSTLANVMKVVLLKVGRPVSELELTYKEACEREAAKLYKNVRTLNLAVAVTPLIGLLGTVQGMIECFYTTANLAVGSDKSQALAQGIYVALLTTFGGLIVAIPAAVLSHYFEGRIQGRFREMDELVVNLIPQLEKYEGKVRMARQTGEPQTSGTT